MDTEIAPRITVNPNKLGGKPCVRAMRIRVIDVLEMMAGGMTREEILQDFPDLVEDDINACLKFAADRISQTSPAA